MEIQRCWKEGWHHQIGFMCPLLVNQKMLNENYKETCQNMYDSLTRQNYKSYILIPYNYGYHWILLILAVESGNLIVFDSMRKPKSAIQYILDPLNRVWKIFAKKNKEADQWREELDIKMNYPCARQIRNWLVRVLVCDFMHLLTLWMKPTMEDLRMSRIVDEVYSTDRINAVWEQLAWDSFWGRSWILEASSTTTVTSMEDSGRRHKGPSSWTINKTGTFVNISKRDVMLFVYL